MAYTLESLVRIIEQILLENHTFWVLDDQKKPQMEKLLEKVIFMNDFLGNSSPVSGDEMERLDSQIRDATHAAEDVLESHIADQILLRREGERFAISPPDLQQVIQDFDAAKEVMLKIMDKSTRIPPVVSSSRDQNPKKIFVGQSESKIDLMEQLVGDESKLQIIPIVGMGGIGKTTLAQNVYDDPLIKSRFDTLAWITISQEYNVRKMLLGLLGCMLQDPTHEKLQGRDDQLALNLHQCLSSRRYLITLDDLWSTDAWNEIKMFFPDNNNSSRIVLTTRETNVADYTNPNSTHHQMHLLNEVQSWNLFCQKVFAREAETCPPELEKIGKRIVDSCGGLPLAIHVMGGMLLNSERNKDSWEQVANHVSSGVANDNDQWSQILSLSYNHLPYHLKPCFLYMGIFPEDHVIHASKLIRLWTAEGFLKPVKEKTLEEAAEVYLKDLVERNLIFVRDQEVNGSIKTYGIHDILRDLCVNKASQEKFLHVNSTLQQGTTSSLRRVGVHFPYRRRDIYGSTELMGLARSIVCTGMAARLILSPKFFGSRLLRILDIFEIGFRYFPEETCQLANLRYLAVKCRPDFEFDSDLHLYSLLGRLLNLQTFVSTSLSWEELSQLFKIPQISHIKLIWVRGCEDYDKCTMVCPENLQTLSNVGLNGVDVENFFQKARNLRKLGIVYCPTELGVIDLSHLQKLLTLKCLNGYPHTKNFLSCFTFPLSLKKLTLGSCEIPKGFMNTVGTLPNLEVLKLSEVEFETPTWESSEGEFIQLQILHFEGFNNLVNWIAEAEHFPRLKHLLILSYGELEEIPSGIADIMTLEKIEVDDSSPSVVNSAKRIQKEQIELGNDGLQLHIHSTQE